MRPKSRACWSDRIFWKSGIWQTSQSRRTASGCSANAATSRIAGEVGERGHVLASSDGHQLGRGRGPLQALEQTARRGEVELAVAPVNGTYGIEAVLLDRLDDLRLERSGIARGAEGAVGHVPPGAARDLGHFGRTKPARLPAVELFQLGEGDVIQVQIEAHADRVGGHQVVHLAGLEHGDLGRCACVG